MVKKYIIWATLITALISFPIGWFTGSLIDLPLLFDEKGFFSPLIFQSQQKELSLLKYSIKNLQNYPYQSSFIVIKNEMNRTPDYVNYVFSFQTLNKTMTGQLNIPTAPSPVGGYPVIVMLRGYVPEEIYQTGTGTKAIAAIFAKNGYVTIAPDFFGFGESDLETEDSWEARLQKPISVIELLKTIKDNPEITTDAGVTKLDDCGCKTGLWAHSNGGQIALTVLEVSRQPMPTSLWAPVTVPFPYSILFFSDEHDDEGKGMRKWVSMFEDDYDVFDFSLTQHLDKLSGSIQIHQGTSDDAVPSTWNDEFVDKIRVENQRREKLLEEIKTSTQSGELETPLPPIGISYFKYPGADHNMKPSWDAVVQRDLVFFNEKLKN